MMKVKCGSKCPIIYSHFIHSLLIKLIFIEPNFKYCSKNQMVLNSQHLISTKNTEDNAEDNACFKLK
jgi:hypothetical protein